MITQIGSVEASFQIQLFMCLRVHNPLGILPVSRNIAEYGFVFFILRCLDNSFFNIFLISFQELPEILPQNIVSYKSFCTAQASNTISLISYPSLCCTVVAQARDCNILSHTSLLQSPESRFCSKHGYLDANSQSFKAVHYLNGMSCSWSVG